MSDYKIPFNRATLMGNEMAYITEAVVNGHISGDGGFTKRCHTILENALNVPKVLLTWGTTRFTSVSVREDERTLGVSNYTFRKLVTHALNMMTGFSILPLQIASWIGIGLALFSVVVLIYVLGQYIIQGTPVPGFPFLASIIGLFSGAQLLALGIIGEYLGRMHLRLQDRPTYVVREELESSTDSHNEKAG